MASRVLFISVALPVCSEQRQLSGPAGVSGAAAAVSHTREPLNVFKSKASVLSDSSSMKRLEPVVI